MQKRENNAAFDQTTEKTNLFRKQLFTVWSFLFFYCVLYLSLGYTFACIVLATGAFLVSPITFWLETKGHRGMSRTLFIISCNAYIYLTSLALKHQIAAEFYFLPVPMIALLTFDTYEKSKIVLGTVLPVILWASIKIFGDSFLPTNWAIETPYKDLISIINSFGAFTISTILTRIFVRSNLRASFELQNLTNSFVEAQKIAKIGNWTYNLSRDKSVWSNQMFEIFEISPNDGGPNFETFKTFIHPEDVEHWETTIRQCFSSGTNYSMRYRIVCKDSQTIKWVETVGRTRKSYNGAVIETLGTCQDITEIKEIHETLLHSSKMSSLGEMAGGIAHEINNPLAIISGKVYQIQKLCKENPSILAELKKIDKTVERIAKIIRSLRSFSRDADRDPMDTTNLFQVVEDTLELCAEKFKNSGIKIVVSGDRDVRVTCVSTQISQVIMNLLSNSRDAVETLEKKWVNLSIERIGDNAVVRVTDSGKGISDTVMQKLMQPFFTTKAAGKGTGLGLSISKNIVEKHGGSLVYDREFPNTSFLLTLPISEQISRAA